MDTNEYPNSSVKSRLDWLPILCLLLGFAVVMAHFSGWIFVFGCHVVRTWVLSSAFLLASFVLWRVRVRRHPGSTQKVANGSWMRTVASILLAVVVGFGGALAALGDLDTKNFVLKPRGPGYCRAVVRETSFLNGSGEVYAVGITGIGRSTGRWFTDDPYRPIEDGNYSLKWGATGGELSINGAYVSRTLEENIARRESLQPRIDSGELSVNALDEPESFEKQPINCY